MSTLQVQVLMSTQKLQWRAESLQRQNGWKLPRSSVKHRRSIPTCVCGSLRTSAAESSVGRRSGNCWQPQNAEECWNRGGEAWHSSQTHQTKARKGAVSVRVSEDQVGVGAQVEPGPVAKNAADAVNLGLELFKKGKVRDALKQFDYAMQLNPSPEEAQAALYNKACCHAYREEGQLAQSALKEALGKYDLRFSVILSDPDLAPFRALPEFKELQEEARRGGDEVGAQFRRDLKLISETQSPFRGVRKFIYIALTAAAGISTVFTLPRVIAALGGGGADGTPSLLNTLGNLGINIGGGALFAWLFIWEQQKEEEQILKVNRNETLSRLPLRLQSGKLVELVQLRESYRPIILAGKRESVNKALKSAESFRNQLLARGIVIVPVVLSGADAVDAAAAAKRKGFGTAAAATARPSKAVPGSKGPETIEEFEERAREAAAKRVSELERRLKAEAVSVGEWVQWLREQQELEDVKPGDDVYLLLRLDGRVRKSGKGMPDWADIIIETPELDSFMSKLER